VKVGTAWKYYDPASSYLACGSQLWEQQGTPALIADSKKPEWVKIPLSKPAESQETHTARLKMTAEGDLSGSVSIKYTGHMAVAERRELLTRNAGERGQYLTDEMKSRFGSPEVTGIGWENVDDMEKPLVVRFNLNLTGYVQHTGKRIFVQPAIFQYNNAPRFPGSTRKHPVYFHYPWSEVDDISIEVPPGYEFDHPDVPQSMSGGDTVSWKVTASIKGGMTLQYKRGFQFGGDGNIILPVASYAGLKKVFDMIHEGDEHAFALKESK
jgi:hypothetical protein